jgi:tetratricopeptide (TPR) repeat protein
MEEGRSVRSTAEESAAPSAAVLRRRPAAGAGLRRTPLAALAVAVLVAVSSCGDDGPGSAQTASGRNEAGWEAYLLGDYAGARGRFEEALALDAGLVEAVLGLAWCDAQLGEHAASVEEFDEVLDSGQYVTDAFAGRAAPALELLDFDLAVASSQI